MTDANRSVPIDCLRGFAIAWVMFYHFVPLPIFDHGTYGVLLFFIISGYCISFSAETSRSAWHFYSKRLGRLLPAMIVCGLVTTVAKHLAPSLLDHERMSSWWDFFYTPVGLATVNALQRSFRLPDGTYWSLVVEFEFYALCFAAMLTGLRNHLLPILCIVSAVITLIIHPVHQGTSDFFPFFIAGVSVAMTAEGRTREAMLGIGFAWGIDAYHLLCHVVDPSIELTLGRSIFLWIGTIAVYLASVYRPSEAAKRMLAPLWFVGLVSYPLYLIHFDVGQMIINGLSLTDDPLGLLIRGTALPALLFLVATAVYLSIERRAIAPLTNFLASLETRSLPAVAHDQRVAGIGGDRKAAQGIERP